MKIISLALRLLLRDWRSGELSILALALLIAVASTATISLFGDRLQRTMVLQAAELMAGDLVVTSHSVLPEAWLQKADQLGLRHARTAGFGGVVFNRDEMLLVGVKAVSSGYPLRGYLKTTTTDETEEVETHAIPERNTVWVDKRVLSSLDLSVGDEIEVGDKRFRIARILTFEPDRKGNFYSLSPRVMLNDRDLAATGMIQPGSHVHYYFLFAGSEPVLARFKKWLQPQLNPSQRIMDVHEDRPQLGTALSRAERYLGLTSIIVIVIAGVAIAMATRRYSERHYDMTAMLRCLGAGQTDILVLYCLQLAMIGLGASLVGCLIGWFAQEGLIHLLEEMLPHQLARPGWGAVWLSLLTGLVTLIGFALPPVLRQKQVSPLRVLRRDLKPLPPSAWLVYGLAFSVITAMLWRYTNDVELMGYIIGGGLAAMVLLYVLTLQLLKQSRRLLPLLSLSWRFGLQNLSRQAKSSTAQILAFGITLTAMIVMILVRGDLIETWQAQLPERAPNHFALNIFQDEWQAFANQLQQEQLEASAFYPIVRGRLVAVNGVDVHTIAKEDSQGGRAISRDLSLTFAERVPVENKIVQGHWWQDRKSGQVSVEATLAKSLRIELGDQLTFSVGSERLEAEVVSIRSVRWDTMNPNFYMIFSDGTLDGYARTYLTSFYLPPDDTTALKRLLKAFPHVTILEVELILKQFRTILQQVTLAVEFVLVFALAAGLTVLFAAVYTSIDERIYEAVMLRTFGASRQLLRNSQLIEYMTLGLFAGVLAAVAAEMITWTLYRQLFDLTYHFNGWIWLMTPLAGMVIIGLSGFWSTRSVVSKSPMTVLRELS